MVYLSIILSERMNKKSKLTYSKHFNEAMSIKQLNEQKQIVFTLSEYDQSFQLLALAIIQMFHSNMCLS